MKDIEFLEVGMKNFGPYQDTMILKFINNQLTLLVGPNGVGKTMALDAIPFTLFGMTSKGLKGDDVVNNVIGKDCHTWVKFNSDNDKFIANRYQKYSKFGGNNLVLNMNGVDIKSGAREVQPFIERLICPSKGFMNTLMFGQKVKDFFTDLTDSKQKEIFRKLIGLDNFVEYYDEASARIKALQEALGSSRQQIAIKLELLKDTEVRIAELIENKKQFERDKQEALKNIEQNKRHMEMFLKEHIKERDELLKQDHEPGKIEVIINNLLNNLSNIDREIESKRSSIRSQKEAKVNELKQTAEVKKAEVAKASEAEKDSIINDWRAKEKKIDKKISDAKEEYNISNGQIEQNRLKSEYARKDIDKIKASVFDSEISTCPVCHQAITEHTKEDLANEIKELEKQIHESMCSVEELSAKLSDIKRRIDEYEKQKRKLDADAGEALTALGVMKAKETNKIEERLKQVLNMVEATADKELEDMINETMLERQKLANEIQTMETKYEEVKKVAKDLEFLVESIRSSENALKSVDSQYEIEQAKEYDETQLNGYRARSIQYSNEIKKIQDESKDNERKLVLAEFWKAAYSPAGIPSMLTDEAIPFMNKKVSEYLDQLSNGRYIVSFDTQGTIKSGEVRDKISVNVIDTYTRANQRLQLSGGQTRLVDIATILTLGDLQASNLGIKVNLLIFDEIFDSLDDQNIDYVSKVLTKLKKGRSIYLISHRHQDHLEADNILEIRS